jgi:hypothetical protein
MPITDATSLGAYLEAQNISYSSIEQLTGGTANFVWLSAGYVLSRQSHANTLKGVARP